MLNNIKKKITYKYKNWSFDTAMRYLPVVEFINNKYKNKNCKILEIGSGNIGIAPYLDKEIIGVDKYYYNSVLDNLKIVKGDARKLPFKDSTFDIVLSLDMLEHISNKERAKVINEMIRVSSKYFLIGFPTGEPARKQDEFVSKLTKNRFGKEDQFISEHIKYMLPRELEFMSILNKKKKVKVIKVIDNFPVYLRYLTLSILFTESKSYLRIYFLLNFMAGFLLKLKFRPYYRKIFIFEKYEK